MSPCSAESASATASSPFPPACPPGCQGGIYTVRPGDTMFLIAQRLGVPLDALIRCNPQIPNPNLIFPGQQLCIPSPLVPVCAPECQGGIYTVQPGDTMFLIAQRLGVPLDALIRCNPQIPNPNLIFPGQQLCIPSPAVPSPCCLVLHPVAPIPGSNALGVALVRQQILPPPNNTAVTVAAHDLPDPSTLGGFDAYEVVLTTPVTQFRFRLFPTAETPPTWAGTRTGLPPLPPQTTVQVRPFHTQTQAAGAVQLANTLANCRAG